MSTSSQRQAPASDSSHASPSTDFKRRRFLFALGAGGAGAVAAAQPLAQPLTTAAADPASDAKQGYRETQHVRDYYATTRI